MKSVTAHWNADGSCSNCGECRAPYDLSSKEYCHSCGAEMCEDFELPTKRQLSFACDIQAALEHDGFGPFWDGKTYKNKYRMSKGELRDCIANILSDNENRKKVGEYIRHKNKRKHEERMYYAKLQEDERRKREDRFSGCYTNEALYGEWSLDASDFGAQAWGDS